jgi:hypothetical protein
MEPHDFWNPAGRAGRWGRNFKVTLYALIPDECLPNGVPKRSRGEIQFIGNGHRLKRRYFTSGNTLENRGQTNLMKGLDVVKFEQVTAYLYPPT